MEHTVVTLHTQPAMGAQPGREVPDEEQSGGGEADEQGPPEATSHLLLPGFRRGVAREALDQVRQGLLHT